MISEFENAEKIEEYTQKDENLKQSLLKEGFGKWRKKDFIKFIRACELYGVNDYENISRFMKSKTVEEVEIYVNVFMQRINSLPNGKRILAKISKSETEKQKILEYGDILEHKMNELSKKEVDVMKSLKIQYKSKNLNTVHE